MSNENISTDATAVIGDNVATPAAPTGEAPAVGAGDQGSTPGQSATSDGQQGQPAAPTGEAPADGSAVPAAPESYADFTLPEGMSLDRAQIEPHLKVFKEIGLSQEQAQKVIDAEVARVQAAQAREQAAVTQQIDAWVQSAKSDPEIGGDKYDQSVATARIALGKFGSPALVQLLEATGLNKHPEMVRAFNKIGAVLREDSPDGGGAPVQAQKTIEDRWYGTATQ